MTVMHATLAWADGHATIGNHDTGVTAALAQNGNSKYVWGIIIVLVNLPLLLVFYFNKLMFIIIVY